MRIISYILFFAMLTVSCAKSPVSEALKELDATILQSESIKNDFLSRTSRMRMDYVNAQGDSAKWVYADHLFDRYYPYSLDSTLLYLKKMQEHAVTKQQRFSTTLSRVNVQMVRMNNFAVLDEYHSIDTAGCLSEAKYQKEYLSTGIALYHHINKTSLPPRQEAIVIGKLQELRRQYINIDSTGFNAQKNRAQYERDNGDHEASLSRLLDLYFIDELSFHNKALAAYNIAIGYKNAGDTEQKILWLARAATYDLRSCCKDYLSLYELALALYDKGYYHRANKYIEVNLVDALLGNFNARYINSGKAHLMITEAERQADRTKIILMIVAIVLLIILVIVFIALFRYSSVQRHRVKKQRDILHQRNNEIRVLNANLKDVSKIKENYVFRYMEMAIYYLDRFDDFRNHIRSIAHSYGLEQAMKELRSREDMYREYDRFYTIFDETFLGIYPDFVEKVNALLKEDARFPIPASRQLRTELRILAVIKLGITESGKIATFLKCAPPTVYTYRAKLRNLAICDKDEFEDLVRQIQ